MRSKSTGSVYARCLGPVRGLGVDLICGTGEVFCGCVAAGFQTTARMKADIRRIT